MPLTEETNEEVIDTNVASLEERTTVFGVHVSGEVSNRILCALYVFSAEKDVEQRSKYAECHKNGQQDFHDRTPDVCWSLTTRIVGLGVWSSDLELEVDADCSIIIPGTCNNASDVSVRVH